MNGVMILVRRACSAFDMFDYLRFLRIWPNYPTTRIVARIVGSLSSVHVSLLKRYHGDGNYIIKQYSILLDKNLAYE